MVEAIKKLRYSKIDQECLIKKIEQWREESPEDQIYFQPKGSAVVEKTFKRSCIRNISNLSNGFV